MKSSFKEKKSTVKRESVLSSHASIYTILRFLQLEEISYYAQISKSINHSLKLCLESRLVKEDHLKPEMIKLIKSDALTLFANHPVSVNKANSRKLDKALKNLMQGNVTQESIDEVLNHEFKASASHTGIPCGTDKSLQNYRKQQAISQAADTSLNMSKEIVSQLLGLDYEDELDFNIDYNDEPNNKLEVAAFMLSGLLAVGGGMMKGAVYLWRYMEDRTAADSHQQLKNRIEVLKNDFKGTKNHKKEDRKDSYSTSIFRPW